MTKSVVFKSFTKCFNFFKANIQHKCKRNCLITFYISLSRIVLYTVFIYAKKNCFFFQLPYFFFPYLNELPLFQFAVISLVRNGVICFSTFFHTFKNFYSPSFWTFCGFRLFVCQKFISVLFTQEYKTRIVFLVEILSNWQSLFSSFSTFRNGKPRSKHRRFGQAKYKFLCLAESVT